MRIVYHQRRPSHGTFSVEGYFEVVRRFLPPDITPIVSTAPYPSEGLWRRVANAVKASLRQGDVNHVTGDIHYVTYMLSKRRTVLTVLDCGFEAYSSRLRRFLLRWLWFKLPEKRVAAVTAISHFTRDRFVVHTGCSPSKVRVVYPCVSPAFVSLPRSFNADLPTILHIGTTVNKNLIRLCEALDGLRCRLHVVGRLSADQLSALSKVEHINSRDLTEAELLTAYAESDMLAFVSTYEGFGLPIVEAQVVGRPVVTSQAASMPEVAGAGACFVNPLDIKSIRAGIERVIRDASFRDAIVTAGHANVKRFAPRAIANQYAELYRELASATLRPRGQPG